MRLHVKICGITNLADARYCAAAGADFLGFVQHEASPRYIEPRKAREIIEWLYGPKPVGVFVNDAPETVNRGTDEARFELVQLHGTESPEVCAAVERPVIKALSVKPDTTPAQLREQMARYQEVVDYVLLDTHDPTLWGGTGTSFDWTVAQELTDGLPVLLAGGISAENVEQASRTVRPFGVDLSSSVEAHPGKKDFEKLGAFFDAVGAIQGTLQRDA